MAVYRYPLGVSESVTVASDMDCLVPVVSVALIHREKFP